MIRTKCLHKALFCICTWIFVHIPVAITLPTLSWLLYYGCGSGEALKCLLSSKRGCQVVKQVGEASSWMVSPLPTRTTLFVPPGHSTTSSDLSFNPPINFRLWTNFSILRIETLERGSGKSQVEQELPSTVHVRWTAWLLLKSSPCSTTNVYLLPCSNLSGDPLVRSKLQECPA